MPLSTIQTSFAAGEMTPELHQRIDLAKYSVGAKKIQNMYVLPQGGVQSRCGTYYVNEIKNSAQKSRLIDFVFSTTQAYQLEFGDHYIRFFMDGGVILDGSNNIYEIYSPYGINDIWQLKTEQSADTLYIVHPNYSPYKLTRTGHASWTITKIEFDPAPIAKENTDITKTLNIAARVQVARPNQDITVGDWASSAGGALYAAVDETTFNDSDYLYTTNIASAAEIKFSSVQVPYTRNGHVLRIRAGNTWSDQTVALYCGSTLIASWRFKSETNNRFNYNFTLSKAEASLITDYTNLRVRLTAGSTSFFFYWIELQIPMDAASIGTPVTKTDVEIYKGDSVTVTALSSIFTSNHIGSVWAIRYQANAQSYVYRTPQRYACNSQVFSVFGDWTATLEPTTSQMIDEVNNYIEKSEDGGATWIKIKTISATPDTSTRSYNGSQSEPCLFRFTREEDPTTQDEAHWTLDIAGKVAYCYFRITAVASGTSCTATLLDNYSRTNVPTSIWSEAAWSDDAGWPSAISFYQNRLVFGNTKREPYGKWISETDDYESFGVNVPQVTDDAITTRLPGRRVNAIKYFVPLQDLITFTDSSEWTTSPGGDGILAYNSMKIKPQTYWGCADVRPIIIGSMVIFLQRGAAKVMGYAYDADGYKYAENDLSVMAKHLFDGYTITDWAYQQTPNSILWCVRSDGMLLSFTFHREHEVWAWARHTTQGQFESVSVIPGAVNDEVYFIVKRTINEATKRFVERLAQRDVTSKANFFGVDCGLIYSGAPTTTITGIPHLNGMTVTVLADGSLTTKTVSSGSITLNTAATKVHIGLGFEYQLDTLRTDINNSADKKKLIEGAIICVKDSYGGKMGANQFVDIKYPSNNLSTEELNTGMITGWNKNGGFTIKGNGAHPMHITSLIPRQTVGGV